MSKKSFIAELEKNGFSKMESDAYADSYGLNVVFEGNEMILADKDGYEIGRSSS